MDSFLKDKVVLISGSRMGIGKALAFQMAHQGAKIVINARTEEALCQTENELKTLGFEVLAVAGDVSDLADCEAMIQKTIATFGRLDILVNNAGLSAKGSLSEASPTVFAKLIEVNLMGSYYLSYCALPHLLQTKGSVLFVSSVAGIHGLPYHGSYSASKMALTALAETLKIELQGTGVFVGIAYVGFTENDQQKTTFNPQGELEVLPKRTNVKLTPTAQTADKLIRQIIHREFRVYHSLMGKVSMALYRLSPNLVVWMLTKLKHKMQ